MFSSSVTISEQQHRQGPPYKQGAAARRRKRIVLCRSCHQALHAGTLTNREQDTEMRVRRAGGWETIMSGSVGGGGMSSQEASPSRPNAEMGAAYLCAEAGISTAVIENQAAYVAGWVK